MRPLSAVLLLATLLPLSTGCSPRLRPADDQAAPTQPSEAAYARPSDSLLQRPDLQAVVERQTRRNATALRERLRDRDAAVRARAALALGSVQDTAAVPLLVTLLDDLSPAVRADVAFALGQSADAAAELPLIDALRDEADPAVQRLLLYALGKTGGEATLSALPGLALASELDVDRAIAIARYGLRAVHHRDAVDWLARHLTDPDPALREHAAYYFGRIADPDPWRYATDLVIAASDSLSPSEPAQQYLALALGRLDVPGAEARLLQLLRLSGDWRVRTNAARSLAGPGSSSPVRHALLVALDDPSAHVAAAAAGAIGAADSLSTERLDRVEAWIDAHPERWRVWAPLLPALARSGRVTDVLARVRALDRRRSPIPAHEAPFARAAALGGLAGSTDPAALDVLRSATDDADARVAYAALEALKASWRAEYTAERAPFYFEQFVRALRRRDLATAYAAAPALADSLFRPLGSSDALRTTYGEMRTPDDIEPMVEIVRALGEIRDTTAVPFLLDVALKGTHPTIRQAAATTLSERFGEGIDFEATGLTPPDFPALDWSYLESLGRHPRLTLRTDRGEVVLKLDTEAAPLTVQTLTRTARRGDYDGVPFHRVVSNFVVQGGDYVRADGFGGPGLFLPSEFARVPYARGTVGMASAGKDTEGSQFFITHSMQPHLDGRYTAFGRVVRGQEVVDRLLQGDRVLRATVEPGEDATP